MPLLMIHPQTIDNHNRKQGRKVQFVSAGVRRRILNDVVRGNSDRDVAARYGINYRQVRKFRYNYRVHLEMLKKEVGKRQPKSEKPPLPKPILKALDTLGERLVVKANDTYYLDGRLAGLKQIVMEANAIRKEKGEPLIFYPCINPLPDIGGPSMILCGHKKPPRKSGAQASH